MKRPALLIPKPILRPAIRTIPGNSITGHSPDIFIHAHLADGKPAPAGPGERGDFPAAMAGPVSCPTPALSPLYEFI
jgi:hypothetical protein